MKQIRILYIIFILLGFQSCVFSIEKEEISLGETNKETQNKRLNTDLIKDFENIYTDEQERYLNKIVNNYRIETNREICIITTNSLEGFDNEDDYALDAFNKYDIGGAKQQLGLIIVVSKTLRILSISAGREAKKEILDAEMNEIYSDKLKSNFKADNFFAGTINAVEGIIKYW